MRELLSNNSPFVGPLYEDKSSKSGTGTLRARDLIIFTTDLQIVNYYSTITAIADLFLNYNRLFCCNHTCYCVGMVAVTSASRYVTSASRYQSRSSIYILSLIPRNSTELDEAVPIKCPL